MKLTSKNVETIFIDCLFNKDELKDGNPPEDAVMVEGVINKFGFHPKRLESHWQEIRKLLMELPENFQSGKGGGWSFLNACMDKDGHQWGEHRNIEQLLALGIATKQVKIQLPRDMWKVLPGGMPYFCII